MGQIASSLLSCQKIAGQGRDKEAISRLDDAQINDESYRKIMTRILKI
jgi:hypothetical protein